MQILGADSMVDTVNESLCVVNHVMEVFQQITVRVKYFTLVDISPGQRFAVGIEAISLDNNAMSNALLGINFNGISSGRSWFHTISDKQHSSRHFWIP